MSVLAARLESAIARLEALSDATARAAAQEALSGVLELHAEGLRRLLARVRELSPEGSRLLAAVAEDELVASLLSLHDLLPDLHPAPVGRREVRKLEVPSERRALVTVDQLVRRSQRRDERCELCAGPLGHEHEHVFDVERRKLQCACRACAVLLDRPSATLRRVRRQSLDLGHFHISRAQWAALEVPVGLAFFSRSTALGQVMAGYPGPAGAIESAVPESAWAALVSANPVLEQLEPDTSALLAVRLEEPAAYHVLPIDECYRLTALVRSRWQGLTGGDGPIRAIEEYFGARLPNPAGTETAKPDGATNAELA